MTYSEQAEKILEITSDYMDESEEFYKNLDNIVKEEYKNSIEYDNVVNGFIDNAWWGMYYQRVLNIISDGVIGVKD